MFVSLATMWPMLLHWYCNYVILVAQECPCLFHWAQRAHCFCLDSSITSSLFHNSTRVVCFTVNASTTPKCHGSLALVGYDLKYNKLTPF